MPDTSAPPAPSARSVADLPDDELRTYAVELGIKLGVDATRGDLLRAITDRQALLNGLDHDAMLDIAKWARLPVRQSATREELVREIARTKKMEFDGLSDRGLVVLAALRGVEVAADEPRAIVIRRLRRAEPIRGWLSRKGRSLVASAVSRVLENAADKPDDYQFLPEEQAKKTARTKEELMDVGIMSGIAGRLRGAADDYVRAKLDEIETRIDRKLDQIDARLSEWRDREVANRLKIIRITLIASVLVAILSLAYKYVSGGLEKSPAAASTQQL